GQVLGGVPLLYSVAILGEVHVELPMQVVLDPPVVTQAVGIVSRAGLLVTDEVAGLAGGFPLGRPLAVTHANRGQVGPGVGMTNPLGGMQDRVAAVLLAAMTTLAGFVGVVVHAGELGVERLHERLLDVLQEVLLVVLDREGIVPALVYDLPGDGL